MADAQAEEKEQEAKMAAALAARGALKGSSTSQSYPKENTEVGSGIMGGSWLNSAERYQKEQQMEEINQQRSEPLSRDDSLYEEMNNPSDPQE